MTAPTCGLGEASPKPWRARSIARLRNRSSLEGSGIQISGTKAHFEDRIWFSQTRILIRTANSQTLGDRRAADPNFFAHADESHRQSQFARDGNHYAALGSTVELGEHNASHAGRLGKQ